MGSEDCIFYTDSLFWDMWVRLVVFETMFYVYCFGTFTGASEEKYNIVSII